MSRHTEAVLVLSAAWLAFAACFLLLWWIVITAALDSNPASLSLVPPYPEGEPSATITSEWQEPTPLPGNLR